MAWHMTVGPFPAGAPGSRSGAAGEAQSKRDVLVFPTTANTKAFCGSNVGGVACCCVDAAINKSAEEDGERLWDIKGPEGEANGVALGMDVPPPQTAD